MKKLMTSTVLAGFALVGAAVPAAAATHSPAHHHKHGVKQHACKGLGIDIALGGVNYCLPL